MTTPRAIKQKPLPHDLNQYDEVHVRAALYDLDRDARRATATAAPRTKRKPQTLPQVLSREDAARLLSVPNVRTLTGLRHRVALQLMRHAGLRVSEVCNLRPAHVRDGYVRVIKGKGKKDRTVPLDRETLDLLVRWEAKRPDSPWYLCGVRGEQRGAQLDVRSLRDTVYRVSRQAGVYLEEDGEKRPVHPHTLRHCFATECLEDGFSIVEVAQMCGHASIATTQIYTHVRPALLKEKMLARGPSIKG